MLNSLSHLRGAKVSASDGDIGTVIEGDKVGACLQVVFSPFFLVNGTR